MLQHLPNLTKQWADKYAVTLLNGLSIRKSADDSTERIYKLKEGQTVKIIGRNEQKVKYCRPRRILVSCNDGRRNNRLLLR